MAYITNGDNMKKLKYVVVALAVFLLMGCTMSNTPTSKVEDLFSKYQTLDNDIKSDIEDVLKEQNLTDTQVERYKKLLEDQYRNLTYEIKNEKIDGDHAIVTVQIEVIDYKKSISDLTYDSTKYTKESYDDAKLDLLEKAKDKVTYTLELGVTKDKNNNWRLDSLSNADIKKIQGMY